jgi:septum formation protein
MERGKETMFISSEPIILASGSPRRKQFMEELGLTFTLCPVTIDETPSPGEPPEIFVSRMAREKGEAASSIHGDCWIVSGDTVVSLDQKIMGKPADEAEALDMLMSLAGREHVVMTGICLLHDEKKKFACKTVSTRVVFSDYSKAIAALYIRSGESLDKAGGYAIQGKGAVLVKAIEGSYTNVVGMPLNELLEMLLDHGVVTVDSGRKNSNDW